MDIPGRTKLSLFGSALESIHPHSSIAPFVSKEGSECAQQERQKFCLPNGRLPLLGPTKEIVTDRALVYHDHEWQQIARAGQMRKSCECWGCPLLFASSEAREIMQEINSFNVAGRARTMPCLYELEVFRQTSPRAAESLQSPLVGNDPTHAVQPPLGRGRRLVGTVAAIA